MYHYQAEDKAILTARANQFCDQIERFLKGEVDEELFRSLRLSNGLYMQKYAPMLRIAVPYGLLNSAQLRALGEIAQVYDKGYGHISTRQNVQFNWIELKEIPKVIQKLASVHLHSIQTSGNVVRNITSDPLAYVAKDEQVAPLVYCEILRQFTTLHPEYQYLPRKFKVAIYGASQDRSSAMVHDIGVQVKKNTQGEVVFKIMVGGGMGRTPMLAQTLREDLPEADFLNYIQAIIRIYNLYGRRDNLYKARIKILVSNLGIEQFKQEVEAEFLKISKIYPKLTPSQVQKVAQNFDEYPYLKQPRTQAEIQAAKAKQALWLTDSSYAKWFQNNTQEHKLNGYVCVYVSCKTPRQSPGDLTSHQFLALADLADQYNQGEIRLTQDQNAVFAHIKLEDCFELQQKLQKLDLATPNINHINNITCCPGLDYCSLADAFTHDVVKDIQEHFEKKDKEYQLTHIRIGISGCINSCAHHHVCDIGILGLVKGDEPHYQIRLAGSSSSDAKLAYMIGPAVAKHQLIPSIEKIIAFYHQHKQKEEKFHQTLIRLGDDYCKEQMKQIIYN